MAAFIRERVEPREEELKAILKFDLPGMATETYHRSPAMIGAESAFGAAALLEAGPEHRREGLALANTVLSGHSSRRVDVLHTRWVAVMTLLAIRNQPSR